ncbi:MAG: phosphoribosyl-ATP diphosphatase [bacterium]|nr:phosphoribosyl-ATP diphosphatase [bacterium]
MKTEEPAIEIINDIYKVILERKKSKSKNSYTVSLFKKGKIAVLKKIAEETAEVILASRDEKKEEIIHEMADLWFHTLVLLGYHAIAPDEVYAELKKRFGKSGLKKVKGK